MKIKSLAVFDIDGTLHETHIMSLEAYKVVMPQFSLNVPTLERLKSTYGCNYTQILHLLQIPTDLSKCFLKAIEEEECNQMEVSARCYSGVLDSLQRLHEDSIVLAVCSMCSPSYMDAFLRRFELQEMIPYRRNESSGLVKSDLLRELLDECEPEHAVMVGDRVFDFDAAKKNNIPSIGCLYGYSPDEAALADATIENGSQIYSAVMAMLRR